MSELDEARKKIDDDQYSERLAAGLLEQIKYSKSLEDINKKLRLELHTLRFKESQEQRFIWWVWNVYSKNVNDLILSIISATTYDSEPSPSDVSVTQDVLMDIKKDLSDAEIEELGAQQAESKNICPSCDGAGELAGDYFSDDGMFSCGQCQGRGVI